MDPKNRQRGNKNWEGRTGEILPPSSSAQDSPPRPGSGTAVTRPLLERLWVHVFPEHTGYMHMCPSSRPAETGGGMKALLVLPISVSLLEKKIKLKKKRKIHLSPKRTENMSTQKLRECPCQHSSTIVKKQKQAKCLSTGEWTHIMWYIYMTDHDSVMKS